MHELSIAHNLVEIATQAIQEVKAERVETVHLKLGVLSGVVKDALQFGYDIATKGTPLADSRLKIEDLPVVIYCRKCQAEYTLPDIQWFACPVCATPTSTIVQGREIEIESLEIIDGNPNPQN